MQNDLAGERNAPQQVKGLRFEFQRTLVTQLGQYVLFNFRDIALRIDEVIEEDFLQRLQRIPGSLLEHLVALARGLGIEIRFPHLVTFPDPGGLRLLVGLEHFSSA